MINPYERAQQARERAVHAYMAEADNRLIEGDELYLLGDMSEAKAVAVWERGMEALDAALIAAEGLNLENKESA